MQLTLMGAAVYKRIQPRELVPSTRKDSANLQHLIMLFQKCALLVEFELLKDSLDLNERVKLCEKFINIAWHCAKCTAVLGDCLEFCFALSPRGTWNQDEPFEPLLRPQSWYHQTCGHIGLEHLCQMGMRTLPDSRRWRGWGSRGISPLDLEWHPRRLILVWEQHLDPRER